MSTKNNRGEGKGDREGALLKGFLEHCFAKKCITSVVFRSISWKRFSQFSWFYYISGNSISRFRTKITKVNSAQIYAAKIYAVKVHSFMTKTKSWKNTAAVKLFDFEFSKLNSPFAVKHGKLKKVGMDHHKEDWQFSSKSLVKLKALNRIKAFATASENWYIWPRMLKLDRIDIFFFYFGFLPRTFTNHRTAGKGGGTSSLGTSTRFTDT